MVHSAVIPMLSLWAVMAAVLDWRHRRLPNILTLGALLVGTGWLLIRFESPLGASPTDALLGMSAALALFLPGWLWGQVGAGDVKLAAAMGLIGGAALLADALLTAGIVAGLMATTTVMRRSALVLIGVVIPPEFRLEDAGTGSRRTLPFGVALAVGFTAALWGWRWLPV